MANKALLNPAPAWEPPRSQVVHLYHGCTSAEKTSIDADGIDLSRCRLDTDFGRGFYTTTAIDQARHWAWNRFSDPAAKRVRRNRPVVLKFRVDRHQLADLQFISFTLGGPHEDDFWSLVQHCRRSTPRRIHDHRGPVYQSDDTRWYDVACGPVSAFWKQKFAMQDADQISFHTDRAVRVLTRVVTGGPPDYDFEVVN